MKKIFAMVAIAAAAFVFGACGTNNGAAQAAQPVEEAPVEAAYDYDQVELELEVEDYEAE